MEDFEELLYQRIVTVIIKILVLLRYQSNKEKTPNSKCIYLENNRHVIAW